MMTCYNKRQLRTDTEPIYDHIDPKIHRESGTNAQSLIAQAKHHCHWRVPSGTVQCAVWRAVCVWQMDGTAVRDAGVFVADGDDVGVLGVVFGDDGQDGRVSC